MADHDMSFMEIQRKSSVSPVFFQSALETCRQILQAASASNVLFTPRRTRSAVPAATPSGPSGSPPTQPVFTPRALRSGTKRDHASLLTPHAHSPAVASPLRRNMDSGHDDDPPTPSKSRRITAAMAMEEDDDEDAAWEREKKKIRASDDGNPFYASPAHTARKDRVSGLSMEGTPVVDSSAEESDEEQAEQSEVRYCLPPRRLPTPVYEPEDVWQVSESSKEELAAALKEYGGGVTTATNVEDAILSAWVE